MVIFWPFDGFLNRGEGFESAAGQERTRAQSCYERRDREDSDTRWPFDGFLNRGEEGFESAAGQERTRAQSCYEEEIEKIPTPDGHLMVF